ncbi:MAG: DUF1015 domain-containing protein [Lachnospiraceae bacterium]|nr:DUF1015 domain-containing protein [Lachnospiraceae bacterium]
MADVRRFAALRPEKEDAVGTGALSYEEVVERYQSGRMFQNHFGEFFVYQVKDGGKEYNGIFACASVDDYLNGVIRNHSWAKDQVTEEKLSKLEKDGFQVEPVILAYHKQPFVDVIMTAAKKFAPAYHFVTENGVEHTIWEMYDYSRAKLLIEAMQGTAHLYIAAGHEIAAASVAHCQDLRKADRNYDPSAEFNYFMCVLLEYESITEDGEVTVPRFQPNMFSHVI